MKINYVTNSRMPTDKAHGVQIAKMCEAFLEAGVDLSLIIPERDNPINEKIEKYYGLRKILSVKRIAVFDKLLMVKNFNNDILDFIASFIQTASFYLQTQLYLLDDKQSLVYTRDHYSSIFCWPYHRVIWEVHELPKTAVGVFIYTIMAASVFKIVSLNTAVFDFFNDRGFKAKNILLPNGVDLKLFGKKNTRSQTKTVGYLGSFYRHKGVDTMVFAARYCPDIKFVFYGGPNDQMDRLKLLAIDCKNITIKPSIPYNLVPKVLQSFSCLVIPNSKYDTLSSTQTSPLKLAEYLATNKPVVLSDVASLKTDLTRKTRGVYYFSSDDPKDLAKTIKKSLSLKLNICRDLTSVSLSYRVNQILKLIEPVI